MPISLSPSALILVAVMTDPRDLEIARLLGWYRIPLRKAPKVVAVDYLAFYQTGAFGAEKWRIQYISQVRGHELTTRAELLRDEDDHPRAKEEYYKVQIGALERLPRPIQAGKWRRITFLYTTGEYLLKAETINDLVIHSEERQNLWKALRERAYQAQTYQALEVPEVDLDAGVLAVLLGVEVPEEAEVPEGAEVPKVPEEAEEAEVPEGPEEPKVPEEAEEAEGPEEPKVPEEAEEAEVPEGPEAPEGLEGPEGLNVPEEGGQ